MKLLLLFIFSNLTPPNYSNGFCEGLVKALAGTGCVSQSKNTVRLMINDPDNILVNNFQLCDSVKYDNRIVKIYINTSSPDSTDFVININSISEFREKVFSISIDCPKCDKMEGNLKVDATENPVSVVCTFSVQEEIKMH